MSLTRWLDPEWHVPVRAVIRRIRRFAGDHSVSELPIRLPARMPLRVFKKLLEAAGLESVEFEAIGFGPFTFLDRAVLPNGIGLRIDRLLQRLADHKMPWLKRFAIFHVAIALKPPGQ
jgi:hypothetical protein